MVKIENENKEYVVYVYRSSGWVPFYHTKIKSQAENMYNKIKNTKTEI